MDTKKFRMLTFITAGLVLMAIYMLFFYLPIMRSGAGEVLDSSFRIFYFHMPIAITAYLAFFIVFVASVMQLRSHDVKWDIYARSAAEIGVIFALLVLITGSIWARATWGWYWVWEPRLTTSLTLFLVYVIYLLLRQAIEEPESKARLAAVFGIVGFVSVPLSFLSIRLWRSVHPLMFGEAIYGSPGGGLGGTTLQLTLLVNFLAFLALFLTLFMYKSNIETLKEEIWTLRASHR
ncbi:ABC-type transport system involved in cytochrome c biogenesis, permease component [Methanomethylovorans hollandica DSM 15978]|uniref:ABC-type transport system involved in cytochrome c biogenesis, permease component n=1 Tax=Methanomethylovorans hollandica (strain DSM 15978 / NBRC 107637 / DMS1) TaxID=867904 RepID=L0L0I0_METHD|nr:cytochrome c biogenesis protein [Methanomethylovorans hollandica]AGB49759.1 ABC-type transport system involved in cytochrome c biogenesis, permease component [Methanomethylovorans hollandica DSM 15978]